MSNTMISCCKNCKKRTVGCHSTCQTYIVQKVIGMYKNQKALEEYDNKYYPIDFNGQNSYLRKELKRMTHGYN